MHTHTLAMDEPSRKRRKKNIINQTKNVESETNSAGFSFHVDA